MNFFKRITTTVAHKVEAVVSQVENHEALVDAALKDCRAASARARVRLSQVIRDGEAMRRKLAELQNMEETWEQRAKQVATEDEPKALECIKRRNACRKHAAQLADNLSRHDAMEREIRASVERIEERLAELTQQRNTMRSRHSAADAQYVINRIEGSTASGVEDIFDRWEMRITETEYANGETPLCADTLEADFRKQENASELKADLDALLHGKDSIREEKE